MSFARKNDKVFLTNGDSHLSERLYDVGDSVQMGKTLLNKRCSFNEVDFAVGPKFAMLK